MGGVGDGLIRNQTYTTFKKTSANYICESMKCVIFKSVITKEFLCIIIKDNQWKSWPTWNINILIPERLKRILKSWMQYKLVPKNGTISKRWKLITKTNKHAYLHIHMGQTTTLIELKANLIIWMIRKCPRE